MNTKTNILAAKIVGHAIIMRGDTVRALKRSYLNLRKDKLVLNTTFDIFDIFDSDSDLIAVVNALDEKHRISFQMVLVDVADMWAATKATGIHETHEEIMVTRTYEEAVVAAVESLRGEYDD